MKKNVYKTRLTELYKRSKNKEAYLKKYGDYLTEILAGIDYSAVAGVTDCLLKARQREATIFFIGNGGSAATASHFAQDLGEVGRKSGLRLFKTLCLNESAPSITALANDYGYEKVFTGQMKNLFKKDDVLVAISASGNSPNIVEAVKLAKKLKGVTIGLVGFDGGKLACICDHLIWIKSLRGEYGPVEDIHLIMDHMITSYLVMRDIFPKK